MSPGSLAHNGVRVPVPGLLGLAAVVRRVGGGGLQGGSGHLRVDRVLALHRGGGELRGGVQGGVLRLPDTIGILKN